MPDWTAEQERAISLKDRKLLVSAAAGSGKTAVLTERICRRVTDRTAPADIAQLKRQLLLLDGARITTIDSFCLSVLREHSDLTGLDPSFRVGSEEELSLMRNDILEDYLEEKYEEADPRFMRFADCFSGGRSDSAVPELLE